MCKRYKRGGADWPEGPASVDQLYVPRLRDLHGRRVFHVHERHRQRHLSPPDCCLRLLVPHPSSWGVHTQAQPTNPLPTHHSRGRGAYFSLKKSGLFSGFQHRGQFLETKLETNPSEWQLSARHICIDYLFKVCLRAVQNESRVAVCMNLANSRLIGGK